MILGGSRILWRNRSVTLTLRRSDLHTLVEGLRILASDVPKWKAECDELASVLLAALNARRASRVLGS